MEEELRILPCGPAALLAEVADLAAASRLHRGLVAAAIPGVEDLVPAARTVLVRFDPGAVSTVAVAEAIEAAAGAAGSSPDPGDDDALEVEIAYDGADLEWVGEATGLGADGVVAAHRETIWRVAFTGFAPGFGYLVADSGPATDGRLAVPRREDPRPEVPTGAVGLAAEFCGVYPRASPGGWRLIGSSSVRAFDARRDPPALLAPGRAVRFVAV